MEDRNIQLEQLVTKLAEKHRRAFRRSMTFSVLAMLGGTAWLVYTFYQVNKLGQEIRKKTDELSAAEKQLQKTSKALSAINPFLEEYGVLPDKLTADNINANLVKQSLEANREIQTMSSTNVERRRGYSVVYFRKNVDAGKVEAALKEFGFSPEIKTPERPNDATDLIAFGSNVNSQDAKLVAYTLIRAGVDIRVMCRSKLPNIQVVGWSSLQDHPAMTVDQIRGQTEFQLCSHYEKPRPE
jgi:hypothetical protein